MKTKNILLTTLLIFLVGNAFAGKGDTEAIANAKRELESKLNELMYNVPFDDTMGDEKACKLSLVFSISDQAEVANPIVTGENEDLVHWATIILSNNTIEVDPVLKGKKLRVPLSFINQRF